jgi:hypothetical protein
MYKHFVDTYSYTIFYLVFYTFLDVLSDFFEFRLPNYYLTTLFVQIISIVFLISKWFKSGYSYKISKKTIMYLIILTFAVNIKHSLKIYSIHANIPIYQNHFIKLLFFSIKPVLLCYTTQLSYYYNIINLLHLFSIGPEIYYSFNLSQLTILTFIYEIIDLLIIDNLETVFYLDMLLPDVYTLVETVGEFISTTYNVLFFEELSEVFKIKNKNWHITCMFIFLQFLTLYLSLIYRTVKFSSIKENILVVLDAHISNSFTLLLRLLETKYCLVYSNDVVYLNLYTVIYASIIFFHLNLYLTEYLLNNNVKE